MSRNKKCEQTVTISAFKFENVFLKKIYAKLKKCLKKNVKNNAKTLVIVIISLILISAIIELHHDINRLETKNSKLIYLRKKYDAAVEAIKINDMENLLKIIDNAANSTPVALNSTNHEIMAEIESLARNALSRDERFCNADINQRNNVEWCVRDIITKLLHELESKYYGNWIVTVGQSNRCLMNGNFAESHRYVFLLDEVLFEILKYDEVENGMRDNDDTDYTKEL